MPTNDRFSVSEALKFGFSTVIENVVFFLGIGLAWLGTMVLGFIGFGFLAFLPFWATVWPMLQEINVATLTSNPLAWGVFIIKLAITVPIGFILFFLCLHFLFRFLSLGFTKITLELYDYQTSRVSTLFGSFNLLLRGFIANLLFHLMVGIGLLLFVVPGLYLALTYGFYQQAIVDKDLGVLDAFKLSAEITRGAKWHLLGLLFIFGIIQSAASTFFGIGLMITTPALLLATTYVYRRLLALPMKIEK